MIPGLLVSLLLALSAIGLLAAWSRRLTRRLGTGRRGPAARAARLMLVGGAGIAVPVALAGICGRLAVPGPLVATTWAALTLRFLAASGHSLAAFVPPGLADLRLAVDLLGRHPGRVVHDATGRARVSRETRQTVLTPTTVIKQQDPGVARIELEKTLRAADIAATTGLFVVPRVLEADVESGLIVFERLDEVVPLWTWLARTRGERAERVIAAAGRTLAAIHDSLWLPADLGEPLPADWQPSAPQGPGRTAWIDPVTLHGDFNAWNLLVGPPGDTGGDRLVVTDWAGSELVGERVTRGPWVFDAAWLIVTLFRRRLGGLERVPRAGRCGEIFLAAYGEARGMDEDLVAETLRGYLAGLLPRLSQPQVRGRRLQWLRPRLDVDALGRFARAGSGRETRRAA